MSPAPEYVNMLNNRCQAAAMTVEYTSQREGPQHDETWTMSVLVNQDQRGKGAGKTRDAAKAAAAKEALENLGWL